MQDNKSKGRAGLSLAIAYFSLQGYTISVPLNDTQWYDLVIEKDGKFETVQCKFTGSKDKVIKLCSAGGTKGEVYDNILNHPVNWLFCVEDDLTMYLIPMEDLIKAGNKNMITLRKAPTLNGQGFQTAKYIVKMGEQRD